MVAYITSDDGRCSTVQVPECNSSWSDGHIRQYSAADISVAVNTDRGLLTPIVFGADAKSISDINADVRS